MNIMEQIEAETMAARPRKSIDVRPGDTIRLHVRIQEGSRSRIQLFEGTVIRIKRGGPRATITVRKIASGVGVERVFPMASPNLERIDVIARHRVRRAKLHYLRSRRGKAARLKPVREFQGLSTHAGGSADGGKRKKRGKKRRKQQAEA